MLACDYKGFALPRLMQLEKKEVNRSELLDDKLNTRYRFQSEGTVSVLHSRTTSVDASGL
jgi:hypothetical protein